MSGTIEQMPDERLVRAAEGTQAFITSWGIPEFRARSRTVLEIVEHYPNPGQQLTARIPLMDLPGADSLDIPAGAGPTLRNYMLQKLRPTQVAWLLDQLERCAKAAQTAEDSDDE